MKNIVLLFYLVTVNDLGKLCVEYDLSMNQCKKYQEVYNYHINGFKDCVSTSTASCDYMYDIASGLNMEKEGMK